MKAFPHTAPKRLAIINDLSGYGRCSLTVAMPIVSIMEVQGCPLPTAILSNHTEFPYYFFDDYTDRMAPYMEIWEKLHLTFDGILIGFLGSSAQIQLVEQFLSRFKGPQTKVILDPVMGDHGRLYSTYTEEMRKQMSRLVSHADILTPNLTEACFLTGLPYSGEAPSLEKLEEMASFLLTTMGNPHSALAITGIPHVESGDAYVANFVTSAGSPGQLLCEPRVGKERPGTGDIFSSIIAANALRDVPFSDSVWQASHFVSQCIQASIAAHIPSSEGVCFERLLYQLSPAAIAGKKSL